jgi:hypothetical protein
MRCTDCERPLLALFYTMVCESCTAAPAGRFHVGYAVFEEAPADAVQLTYVWRTRYDAVRWRTIRGDEARPIHVVLSEYPFEWRDASGSAAGLTVGSQLCEIYPDHRFPPAENRAFVAPESVDPRTERIVLHAGAPTSEAVAHEDSHAG